MKTTRGFTGGYLLDMKSQSFASQVCQNDYSFLALPCKGQSLYASNFCVAEFTCNTVLKMRSSAVC